MKCKYNVLLHPPIFHSIFSRHVPPTITLCKSSVVFKSYYSMACMAGGLLTGMGILAICDGTCKIGLSAHVVHPVIEEGRLSRRPVLYFQSSLLHIRYKQDCPLDSMPIDFSNKM